MVNIGSYKLDKIMKGYWTELRLCVYILLGVTIYFVDQIDELENRL